MKGMWLFIAVATCSLLLFSLANAQVSNESPLEGSWIMDYETPYYVGGSGIVFLVSVDGWLFRSTDSGVTWVRQDQLHNSINNRVLKVSNLYQVEGERLFFTAYGTEPDFYISFRTEDAGESYTQIVSTKNKLFKSLEFNPNPGYEHVAIAEVMGEACWSNVYSSGAECYHTLEISYDFGANWQTLDSYVRYVRWGNAGSEGVPEDSFYFQRSIGKTGNQKDQTFYDLLRVDNYTMAAILLPATASDYYVANEFVVGILPSQIPNTMIVQADIYVGTLGGPLLKAKAPITIIGGADLTFLDSSTGTIFITFWEHTMSANSSALYISDASGSNYVESMPALSRGPTGWFQFYGVEGVEGVYLAGSANTDNSVQTKISFNRGGRWDLITPPVVDLDGNPPCDGCTLHIYSYIPVYPFSSDRAIGVIIGVGNVGQALTFDFNAMNTYYSRDSGVTWSQIAVGAHIAAVGYHGSFTVLVDFTKPVTTLKYTLHSDAKNFTEFQFTENPITIDKITTVPLGDTKQFLLFGSRDNGNGGTNTFVINVDFGSLGVTECQGADAASEPTSDYEWYTPTVQGSCLLGRNVTYLRRKAGVTCYDPLEEHEQLSETPCQCTDLDFECDYGYHKNGTNHCVLETAYDPTAACVPGNTYVDVTGYRLVGGDKCINPIYPLPTRKPCPSADVPDTDPLVRRAIDKIKANPGVVAGAVLGTFFGILILALVGMAIATQVKKRRERKARGSMAGQLADGQSGEQEMQSV